MPRDTTTPRPLLWHGRPRPCARAASMGRSPIQQERSVLPLRPVASASFPRRLDVEKCRFVSESVGSPTPLPPTLSSLTPGPSTTCNPHPSPTPLPTLSLSSSLCSLCPLCAL